MPNHLLHPSAADLLSKLSDDGLIQRNDADIESFLRNQQPDKELPLYLRALVGIGAFIASLCFIGFVAVGISLTREEGLVVWGLVFVALALGLQKLSTKNNTLRDSFFMQSSFAIMLAGKALFTFGTLSIFDSAWGATLGIIGITAATYPIYRLSVDRFLSTFGIFFSILLNLLWDSDIEGLRAFMFNASIALQMGGVALLIATVKFERDYSPIRYGLIYSLCASTLILTLQAQFGYWLSQHFIDPSSLNLLFTAGLIGSLVWIAGGISGKLKSEPFLLAFGGAALLGVISAPGLLLAITLLILGYAKHDKIMSMMGVLLLPVFLFFYYYNLDISLMVKSGVLIGSGAVMLAGRFYITFKGWDKERIV